MKHVEKNTYFKDVHLFIEKVSNMAAIHEFQVIRKICLFVSEKQHFNDTLSNYSSKLSNFCVTITK